MTTGCDVCGAHAQFRAYASYDIDDGRNAHPHHARYPMPMIRACADHLTEMMLHDLNAPGTTRQWVVTSEKST